MHDLLELNGFLFEICVHTIYIIMILVKAVVCINKSKLFMLGSHKYDTLF